jgi:hypothetical protein
MHGLDTIPTYTESMLQCDTNTINTKSDTLPLSCFLAFKTLPSLQIHREPFLPCKTVYFVAVRCCIFCSVELAQLLAAVW